ncbi:chemotaxis protein CheA [Phaeobacter sp. B1627]|uniref:chemotaxis protein CheA n=1 Tax=Phaeobacter sp. B1627 TaxID=2583809 RepID=UPI001118094D|nr:chemotaxis protein CheA [Phaeobacter sp. B1627]TNJ41786.1 chemotaxis protein CheA [Phaeobacter sp. B1627]
MYHFTPPPTGLMVNLPSAIASANGPHAAALSLSDSDSLTANQLQNQVTQARRARDKIIDQISKPPEPGWKSAVNQISDTVDRMEKVLSFLQAHRVLSASPAELLGPVPGSVPGSVDVYPSGPALQQSGGTSQAGPAESGTSQAVLRDAKTAVGPLSAPAIANEAASADTLSPPAGGSPSRVIYVMDDGVVILGLAPERAARDASGFRDPTEVPLQSSRTADHAQAESGAVSGAQPPGVVVNLPLTEDQQRASQDLIALARKAYAQLQPLQPREAEHSADLITTTQVGITAELDMDPASKPSADRITPADPLPAASASAPGSENTTATAPQNDPLHATAQPFANSASEDAAEATRQQQIIALQLDGHNDIIYIVPPAKATMDLIV